MNECVSKWVKVKKIKEMSECITGMNRKPKTKIEHTKGVYFS